MSIIEFAGCIAYSECWLGKPANRVVLSLSARDKTDGLPVEIPFIVDTGSQYGVLRKSLVEQLVSAGPRGRVDSLALAGATLTGEVEEIELTLGDAPHQLTLPALVIVVEDSDWSGPNILGLHTLQLFTWALEGRNNFHYLQAG